MPWLHPFIASPFQACKARFACTLRAWDAALLARLKIARSSRLPVIAAALAGLLAILHGAPSGAQTLYASSMRAYFGPDGQQACKLLRAFVDDSASSA